MLLHFSGDVRGWCHSRNCRPLPEEIWQVPVAVMPSYHIVGIERQDQPRFRRLCRSRRQERSELISNFLDSGVYSNWFRTSGLDYISYMDGYARFIRRYQSGIDWYANVDVIGDPRRTWEHQQYLEQEYGLRPVPVVHYGTSLCWLDHYLERGYQVIGLGGLAKVAPRSRGRLWLDHVFRHICSAATGIPRVKLHGFGITDHATLLRSIRPPGSSTLLLAVSLYRRSGRENSVYGSNLGSSRLH